MNKRHPYRDMEREYVTSDISIRELCRRHGIRSHSVVVDQAKKRKWAEKRDQYQERASASFIERHADRMADRQADIEDKALDAIDQALDKFRDDMRATEKKLVNGEWVEAPAMRLMPKDVAVLIDRLLILLERPAHVTERHDVSLKSELLVDALSEFIERTRVRAAPPASTLPRTRRPDGADDGDGRPH